MASIKESTKVVDQVFEYVSIIDTCTVIIGLVGNITACIVILSSRSFRTLTGFYLLSLSTADLLMLLTGASYFVFSHKFEFLRKNVAAAYITEWICQTSVMVSTLTVTAFTIERYSAICHPFLVQTIPKKSRVKKIIIAIWLTSALLALLPATLCFFAPMSLIIVMYVLIWLKLKKSSNENPVADRADTRTLLMFVVIVVVFGFSWGTYHLYRIISMYIMRTAMKTHLHDTHYLFILFFKLLLVKLGQEIIYPLSSVLNPFIYLVMSKKFREAFKELFSRTSRGFTDWSSKLFDSKTRSTASLSTSSEKK